MSVLDRSTHSRLGKLSILLLVCVILLFSITGFTSAQETAEDHAIGLELVAEGFTSPVAIVSAGDDTGRLFVVDLAGYIYVLDAMGTRMETPFLDLSQQIVPLNPDYDERGVLGLAFHPDYVNNGRFFVYYSTPLADDGPEGWNHSNVVAEFSVSADDPNMADLASQNIILQINQPQMNHNAGQIKFGPDGYLYIPIGDGGGANDTDMGHTPEIGNAQDTTDLHGSILRIDVDNESPYTIPEDNPFVGDDGIADEIYAYGLRNPFNIFFDMGGDNALYAADAGQDLYEEIDLITAGGNYGWHIKEGTHCFDPMNPEQSPETCASTGANGEALIDPIVEYDHSMGNVVVGGIPYRGSALPELDGYLIFGSFAGEGEPAQGVIFAAKPGEDGTLWEISELHVNGTESNGLGALLLSFGQDANGEVYVLTSENFGPTGETGKVWRMVADDGSMMVQPEATEEVSEPQGMTMTVTPDDEATEIVAPEVTEESTEEMTEEPVGESTEEATEESMMPTATPLGNHAPPTPVTTATP